MRSASSVAAIALAVGLGAQAFVPGARVCSSCGKISGYQCMRSSAQSRQLRMQGTPDGENNIIPKIEEGDQGIKMQVFAKPAPPPDRIAAHQDSKEGLASFENLSPDFLATAANGATAHPLTEEQLKRKLLVAKTFARMAPLILLMRGENIIANEFTYYSPSTGALDKDGFLGLIRTIDRAFPTMKTFPGSFTVYKDGIVSYKSAYRATFDGPLDLGEETISPTGVQVISDVELSVVAFNEAGLLVSYATGQVVAKADEYKDPAVLERIQALSTKIAGNKIKIKGLAGQEHTIAYQKSMEEVSHLQYDLGFLQEQVDVEPNSGGLGGIAGLFHGAQLEWPDVVSNLVGTAPHKRVGGTLQGGQTVPSEATVPIVRYSN